MLRLLVKCEPAEASAWSRALAQELPAARVEFWPDCTDPEHIDYALLWRPDDQLLQRLTALRAIFSLGAGVDHLLGSGSLPADVPVVRLVDPLLSEGMSHYLAYQVLRIHRGFARYERNQTEARWQQHAQRPAARTRVGILGMGELGRDAARHLSALGFGVTGWARSAHPEAPVPCLSGAQGLDTLLADSQILILLLPLTEATRGLIDARALARMPAGAWLINVGRGGLLDEKSLLQALDRGHLAGACLDVFAREPLPADHRFWAHPAVTVTPHVASLTTAASAAAVIAAQIRAHLAGQALAHCVDRSRGY